MLPQKLLDRLRPPHLRPALWHALADLARRRDPCAEHPSHAVWSDFVRIHRQFRSTWASTPALAAVGLELIDKPHPEHERVEGCIWLARFPSHEVVEAMGRIALDPNELTTVRNQAIWTLGCRQILENHEALHWAPDVVERADSYLLALWNTKDRPEFTNLLPALRHVHATEVLDRLAEDVVAAAPGLEAFASPALAHALVDRLADLPLDHAPRLIRLIGHTLGGDAARRLLAYAETAPPLPRFAALETAFALHADLARGALENYLATLTFDGPSRARARWHEDHPGVLPTVRGLAVARITGEIPPAERPSRCLQASRDFASLATIERFAEQYLYTMWSRVAVRTGEPSAIVACAESVPSMLPDAPHLVEPYLTALAEAGRFNHLCQVARDTGAMSHATWVLATHARPFLALALRRLASAHTTTVETVAGGALALFLAGRPELALTALQRERPESVNLPGEGIAPFPGPDELWRFEYESEHWPALTALVQGGLPPLLSQLRPVPDGADPDVVDLELLAERNRDLSADLDGMTVCILGTFHDLGSFVEDLTTRGAHLVDDPFAKTDYFVAGPDADPAVVARLRSLGARELPVPPRR